MDSFLARVFGTVKTKSRGPSRRPIRRALLHVDALEDRVTPATFTVLNNSDTAAGSLRDAITQANASPGADDIVFDAAAFATPQTIAVATSLPPITNGGLVITGPGAAKVNVNGGGLVQVFTSNGNVTMSGMTVSGGVNNAGGGALRVTGTAVLDSMVFSGNSSTSTGGAIFATPGTNLTVRLTTMTNNIATSQGGAIFFQGGGTLLVDRSTLNGNVVTSTANDNGGGGIYFTGSGSVTLLNSTLHANVSNSSGGGVLLATFSGTLDVLHSTLTLNSAANTAGGQGGGGISRITGAGGINVFSSIVSTNTSTTGPDILMPGGEAVVNYSAIGSNTGFTLSGSSANNLAFNTALNLSPNLQNNGGITATRLPLANSPVINRGPASTGTVFTDQRGATFVRVYGVAADIGAVETQTSTIVSISTTEPDPTNTFSINYTVTFNQPTTTLTSGNFALVTTNGVTAFINNPVPIANTNNTQWSLVVNNIFAPAPGGTLGVNMVNSTGTVPNPILIPTPPGNPTVPVDSTPFVGTVRTIDQTAPTVVSINRAGTSPASGPVTFNVTFSEPVTGVAAGNFSIFTAGTVTGGTIAVAPNAAPTTTWSVTVSGYTGNGTLGLDLTSVAGIRDRATNLLANANVPFTGQRYAVGQPVVLSMVPSRTSTNQATVTYTITFSQPVTNVPAANLGVQSTGVAGASVGAVTPVPGAPSSTWTVVVNTGTGEGTVRLRILSGAGITNPTTGQALAGPFPIGGTLVTVDRTAPTLTSISRSVPVGPNTNAATVTYLLTFNEPVDGLALANFTSAVVGLTGVAAVSVTPVGAAPSATWNYTINTGAGVGTLDLSLVTPVGIVDAAGNGLSTAALIGEMYTVDRVAPTVTSIARLAPTAQNTNANTVDFLVTFSEPMANGSALDFDLVTTGTSSGASVVSVAGVGATRTVKVNTGDTEGDVTLRFTGLGTITDLFTNKVSNTGFTGDAYTVDTIEPVVVSVTRVTQRDTNLATVQFTVKFSEAVTTLTAANLVLDVTGSLANVSVLTVAPTAAPTDWLVTVSTGVGDGLLRLFVDNTAGLADGFSNPVTPLPFQTGQDYNVDTTLPTITSIALASPTPTNLPGVAYTVVFSEPVLNVKAANFVLVTTGALVGATINNVTGSGTTWAVSVLTGNGSGTVRLDLTAPAGITDAATNGLTDTETGPVFVIDKSQPSIVSISRSVPATAAANTATVTYRVTFNEDVQNVLPANFALTAAGVTGAAITAVTPVTGSVYDVAVTTGTKDGTLRLDLTTPNGITDLAGNPLTVIRQGEVYTVDKTAPTVTITRTVTQASPTYNQPVQFTVVFNEPVFGFTAADVTFGGSANPTAATVTGSGNSYIVGIEGMTNSGTVTAGLTTGGALDAAGNPSAAPTGVAAVVSYLQPVVTGADTYRTPAQKTLVVPAALGVLANDSSVSGPLTAKLTQAPPAAAGTVALAADGSFVFTPAVGFSGATTFAYTATDGGSTSQPTSVVVNVTSKTVRLAAAAGAGGGPQVVVYDVDGTLVARFFAYDQAFTGGVQVATGDVNGDGVDDIVVGTGVGGAPHIKVFDGVTFGEIASFFAYESTFRGGVQVAVGDINGDGRADVITGTGNGGGPRIRTFSGNGFGELNNFLAYEPTFRGGVNVAVGDIDGDKKLEILASPGFGGGPVVKVFDGTTLQQVRSFFALDASSRDGVAVAVGDVFNDGVPDILIGPGTGSTVLAYRGTDLGLSASIPDAFPNATGGVRVAAKDSNNDNVNDQLLVATGVGDAPRVYRFNLTTMARVDELFGFPADFKGGIYVG